MSRIEVRSAEALRDAPALLRREGAAAVVQGSTVYIFGGLGAAGSATDVVADRPAAAGDAATRWEARVVAHLARPAHDLAAAALDGRAFIFGGGDVRSYDSVQEMDPAAGRLRTVGRLPQPLSDLGAAVVGEAAFLVGGYTGAAAADEVLEYRPSTGFRTVARLPAGLRYAAVAALDGRLVVAGGHTSGGGWSRDLYTVDVATGRVAKAAVFPQGFAYAAAVALDGRVIILGGRTADGPLDRVWSWDGRRLGPAGHLPQAVSDAVAVAFGANVYVIGGREAVAHPAQAAVLRLEMTCVQP
ncbi:MAG: hypothetical protein IMW98_04305 [Firmicutes bacterium]|nr:hypothetical protein [Bacillota bacterium]